MLRRSSGTDGLRWHCLHENLPPTATGSLALGRGPGSLQRRPLRRHGLRFAGYARLRRRVTRGVAAHRLPRRGRVTRLPLKQQSGDFFSLPGSRPICGQAYPARVGDVGQIVWLKLDGPRSPERGYREISVSDEPLSTDAAILAALTVLEGRLLDVGALHKVLTRIMSLPRMSGRFSLTPPLPPPV